MTGKPPVFADPAFARAPTHRRPPLPSTVDLAAMLRDGETLDDLATTFERHPHTLRSVLNDAGFSSGTGEPRTWVPDATEDEILHRPFEFPPWMDAALCAQTDPDAFFPEKGGSTREAKSVCGRCAVAAECLDYALNNSERHGIWGGLSERERRRLQLLLNPETSEEEPDQEEATA